MRTMFKKAVSVVLATAVVVSGASVANGTQASAAKKSKTYKARVYFAAVQGKKDCEWLYGDGKTAKSLTKNVKITKGKKTNVSITIKNTTKTKVDAATVFTIDLLNLLKDYKAKKVKVSGLTVKADGKKKPAKLVAGCFEPRKNNGKYNYRVSVYNKWGTDGDNSIQVNKAKNYAFKNQLTVSFTVVAK